MPHHSRYVQWIRVLDWHGIQELWKSVQLGATPGWEPGRAFEHLILRAFELDGAVVRWPYTVELHDQLVEQVDGAVYAGSLSCLVEAKDTARPVSFDAVGKLRQQLSRRPAGVVGLLFSRTGFTDPALTLARYLAPQNVVLWTGKDLTTALEQRSMLNALEVKYRHLVENGSPEYDLQPVGVE
jgi:hypothetical protein